MTWLTGWNRRKLITVNGSTAGAQSDYQMKLTVNQSSGTDSTGVVYLGGNVLSTFNDLRFTKSDGSTPLNYWIESIVGTTPNQTSIVWIKLAPSPNTIPVSPGTYSFYIYYNNSSATTSVSSGTNTFNFFSTSLWGYTGPTFGTNYAMRGLIQFTSNGPSWGFGWYSDPRIMIISNTSYDPDIRYYSTITGYDTIGESLNINHPYKIFDIIRNGTTNVIVRVDNGSERTYTNMGSDAISIATYSTFNHLWTLVRKYISPEPTFSTIGTEETLTCGTPSANLVVLEIVSNQLLRQYPSYVDLDAISKLLDNYMW